MCVSHFPIWCLDLNQGLSRERWWWGWESGPEPCQVCIHTHHVSEWAFYITLNLDQMAYTQWAAAHWILGHCYTSVSLCVCVCVHTVRVFIHLCVRACLCYLSALPYVWAVVCALCAPVFMSVFVCACFCVHAYKSVALRPGDAVLCVDSVPSPLPVSHSVVFSSSQQQASSPVALVAQYEMHVSCSLYLITPRSFWFML